MSGDWLDGEEAVLVCADYKALEVVILADLCLRLFDDDSLAKAVAPDAPDIHAVHARFVFGDYLNWKVPETILQDGVQVRMEDAGKRVADIPIAGFKEHPYGAVVRQSIKEVFYGWCYGKRGYGFSTLLGADGKMIGEERGTQLVDGLMAARPGLGLLEQWVTDYVRRNFGIYSLGGRWCDLRVELESGVDWMFRRAIRRALNFPAQATGADIIGNAMVRVTADEKLRNCRFKTILNSHDELLLRGPLKHVNLARIALTTHMEDATANGTELLVPLQVSVGHGKTYFECK